MTEKERTFNEKVVAVQSELKAPKGQFNGFGKYKYRSLEDINEAVKPLLAKEGLKLTISDEPVAVMDRIYIKASATLSDGGNSITVNGYAREAENKKGMDESQITGTASSYARKYALNGLFLIDDTKDADSDENKNERDNRSKRSNQQQSNNQQNSNNKLSKTQQEAAVLKLTEFANAQGTKLEEAVNKLFPYLKISSPLNELTADDFGVLMNYLNKK